jgi:hypothetical protein
MIGTSRTSSGSPAYPIALRQSPMCIHELLLAAKDCSAILMPRPGALTSASHPARPTPASSIHAVAQQGQEVLQIFIWYIFLHASARAGGGKLSYHLFRHQFAQKIRTCIGSQDERKKIALCIPHSPIPHAPLSWSSHQIASPKKISRKRLRNN